jgi:hypothetical protein
MALKQKLEAAFASVISVIVLPVDVSIYTGEDTEEQVRPCIVCRANGGGQEEPQASGNRMMDVEIIIKSQADENDTGDALELHSALVGLIELNLKTDTLATDLSAAIADFYVFDPVIDSGQENNIQGRAFVDVQKFKVYACASDVSA